jgi:hypothetical protein
MGGGIFVGIRYKDKKGTIKEVLMSTWTNILPWSFMQPSFLEQGKELNKFINDAKPENEWPKSKLINEIDPDEYGLVLIDFINHTIFSRNDYCEIGCLLITHEDPDTLKNVFAMIEKGFIGTITHYDFKKDPTVKQDISTDQFKEYFRLPIDDRQGSLFFEVYLNNSLFEIDGKSDRDPKLADVKRWLKKNGWTSPINKASFTPENSNNKIKWMKPF